MIPYIIGLLSGVIGGMGIGGGTILIPAFVLYSNIDQHIIQSINLIYFIPTAITALIVHIKNKYIEWKIALSIIICGVLGAVLGAYLAVSLSSNTLRKIFGVFLLVMGCYELLKSNKPKKI